jgi:hypothetical protein
VLSHAVTGACVACERMWCGFTMNESAQSVAGFQPLENGGGPRVDLCDALRMVDFGLCLGLFLQATG